MKIWVQYRSPGGGNCPGVCEKVNSGNLFHRAVAYLIGIVYGGAREDYYRGLQLFHWP